MNLTRIVAVAVLVLLALAAFPFTLCQADPYPHFDFVYPEPQQKFTSNAAIFKIELWDYSNATPPDNVELAFEWAGPAPQLHPEWQTKQVLTNPIVSRQELLNGYLIPLDKFSENKLWRVRARWAATGANWQPWVEFFVQKPLTLTPGQFNGEFQPIGPIPKIASPKANAILTEGDNLIVQADISGIQNVPASIELLMEKGGNGTVPNWVKSEWNFADFTQSFVGGRMLSATSMALGHWRVKLRFSPNGAWSQWTQFKVYQNFDPNKLPIILQPVAGQKINGNLTVKINPNQVTNNANIELNYMWRVLTETNWHSTWLGVSLLQPHQKNADGTYSFTIPSTSLTPGAWMLEAQTQAYWFNGSVNETTGKTGWANRLFLVEGLTVPVLLAPTAGATVKGDILIKIQPSAYKLAKVNINFEHFDQGVWKVTGIWTANWTFTTSEAEQGVTIPMAKMANLSGKWRVRATYDFPSHLQAGSSPWVEFTVPIKLTPIKPTL